MRDSLILSSIAEYSVSLISAKEHEIVFSLSALQSRSQSRIAFWSVGQRQELPRLRIAPLTKSQKTLKLSALQVQGNRKGMLLDIT